MLSNVADLTEVLSAMVKDGHSVSAALVASVSPYIREHIRRFGKFAQPRDFRKVLAIEFLPKLHSRRRRGH